MHISQPEITAGVTVGQFLVIQPHCVEHRSVQIMQVDFAFDGFVAGRP